MKELNEEPLSDKCDEFFKDYPYYDTVESQIAWLRSVVPDDIDPSLYECILKFRKIEGKEAYNKILKDYWQDRRADLTKIKLKSIRDDYFNKVKNYHFYIAFPIKGEVISHKLVSKFTLSPPCYSIPFFEALAEKYGKGTLLNLTLGKVNGRVTVVFSIIGSEDSFYDYSQIPPYSLIKHLKQVPF